MRFFEDASSKSQLASGAARPFTPAGSEQKASADQEAIFSTSNLPDDSSNGFPAPILDSGVIKAWNAAAQFAADENHEQAQHAILYAVALNGGAPDPMWGFIQNWYAEEGREAIGLPLLMFASGETRSGLSS